MYDKSEMRAVMGDITNAVVLNMEYEASIKVHQGREPNMYEKPEMRDVMDAVMLRVRGWHQDPLRKGTQHVGEDQDKGWDAQDHRQGQVWQEREREQRDEQEQHGRLDHRTEAVLLSV